MKVLDYGTCEYYGGREQDLYRYKGSWVKQYTLMLNRMRDATEPKNIRTQNELDYLQDIGVNQV